MLVSAHWIARQLKETWGVSKSLCGMKRILSWPLWEPSQLFPASGKRAAACWQRPVAHRACSRFPSPGVQWKTLDTAMGLSPPILRDRSSNSESETAHGRPAMIPKAQACQPPRDERQEAVNPPETEKRILRNRTLEITRGKFGGAPSATAGRLASLPANGSRAVCVCPPCQPPRSDVTAGIGKPRPSE
jgi:hypothetical protein